MPSKKHKKHTQKRKRCEPLVPCHKCQCKLYPDCRVEDVFGDAQMCEECLIGVTGCHKEGIGPAENAGEKKKKD
jgi:hypothetical protein